MKKIILLVLIVLIIPILIIDDTSKDYNYFYNNYPDLAKDDNWEFFRERANVWSPLKTQEFHHKYEGPILCELYEATKKDSLVFNNLFKELKSLIPNKYIGYYSDYTKKSLDEKFDLGSVNGYEIKHLKKVSIRFYFKENKENDHFAVSKSTNLSFFSTKFDSKQPNKNISGFTKPSYSFAFPSDFDFDERKRRIEFEFIRLIAVAEYFKSHNVITTSEYSILNKREDSYTNHEFSSLDKFLIQKLYASNLREELSTYMYKTYPWRYASSYLNKEKTKVFAIWFCVILGVAMFLLGFSLLYKRNYQILFLKYFIPILFTLISCLYVYKVYTYITIPYEFEHWKQYIAIHVIFVIISGLMALSLMVFDKYLVKDNKSFIFQIVIKVSFTFLIGILPVLIIFLAENNAKPWFSLNSLFLVVFAFSVGRGILLYLEHFSENLIKQKDLELSSLKAANAQAEVRLLQSQINPHFLYNALNSIASLAQTDGAKTEKMALSLSDLFKYTINRKGKKNSTIGDEVEMVKNYLEVEQIRFGDRLKFQVHVDDNLNDIKIPMFLIQPLIENAVKHGISKIEGEGDIQLKISKAENDVVIAIIDNGPHFPDGLVSGHGLQTVYDLLRLGYGENASINMENTPEKAVTITIKNIV